MEFIRTTSDSPCPVCGRVKYCMVNNNGSAVLCTKEPSERQIGEAGWLHVLDPKRNIGYEISEMEKKHLRYHANLIEGIDEVVADLLEVTADSVRRLEVGFWPFGHLWTFPERNERGRITNILKRTNSGRKFMEKGGQRGLIYEYPLPKTDKPFIVVEGGTDTAAAMDMGYVGVGRPSANSGGKILAAMLKGRDVIVVGENDEAGRRGMEEIAKLLSESCRSVQKVLPPGKFKDLREWHPNADEFELWLEQRSKTVEANRVIGEVNVYDLVAQWLTENYTDGDYRTFHQFSGDWYKYNGLYYDRIDGRTDHQLRRELFEYFNTFSIVRGGGKDVHCDRLNPTPKFIDDIRYAIAATTSLTVPSGVSEPFHITSRERLDVERMVVFRNGMLDIATDELRPLNPDIFITSTLPFDFDPRAACDLWRGFVRDIFNGDEECCELLQEWFGYNLIASNRMQQMMMLYGVRNSGKSTTLQILQALLGPERVTSFTFDGFRQRFGPAALFGKYAAVISEDRTTSSADSEKLVQQLKKIIGEDTIQVERKYRDPFVTQLFCRFTYAGNELPRFHDDQGAFLRRFNLLYYPNDYTKSKTGVDRRLYDKLKAELPGIANWALVGLRRLLKNDGFTQPAATAEHLADYCELSCPLSTLAEQHCELGEGPEYITPIHWLFELHKAVYEEWGLKPMGSALFRARFKSVFPSLKRKRRSVGGKIVPVWEGIRIRQSTLRDVIGVM